MRVFYPTHAAPSAFRALRPANVPHWKYYYGMLVFQFNIQRANALVRGILACACRLAWCATRFTATIRATMHASLIADDGEKLDVIIFSHGLSGFRTCNANVACELAARGCVVFCAEHRDGSATATASSGERNGVQYQYYTPTGGTHESRRAQTSVRVTETLACAQSVDYLHAGDVQARNAWRGGGGRAQHVLNSFKGRLNVDSKTLCGFSFGGGSSCATTAQAPDVFARCILLDAWLEYFNDDDVLTAACSMPTLSLLSEKWGSSALAVKNATTLTANARAFYEVTIDGAKHHDFSDARAFLGLARNIVGMVGSVNIHAMHAFVAKISVDFIRNASNPKISRDDARQSLGRICSRCKASLPGARMR